MLEALTKKAADFRDVCLDSSVPEKVVPESFLLERTFRGADRNAVLQSVGGIVGGKLIIDARKRKRIRSFLI